MRRLTGGGILATLSILDENEVMNVKGGDYTPLLSPLHC